MSITDSLVILWLICVIPWLLAGWFRIPRYTHYFQQADYKYQSYVQWFLNNNVENRYFFRFVLTLVSLPPLCFCAFPFLPSALFSSPFPVGIVYFALLLLAMLFAPHDRPNNPQFTRTQRKMRLVLIAFFIEFLPVLVGTWLIWGAYNALADPRNSPKSMGVLALPALGFIIFLSASMGPIAFIFTRYTLPIANVINWPIDKMLMWRTR